MRIRLLCSTALIAALVVLAARAATAQVSCDCCAKKPRIDDPVYATFSGQVVIATQKENADPSPAFSNRVVMIWDLTHQNGAPLNTWWDATHPVPPPHTQPYSHTAWNFTNLGDVFGLTLDATGNIYVAATSIMGGGVFGSLSTCPGASNNRAGQIYKLQNGSGLPVPFACLPQGPMGEGVGNIEYDCGHNSFYASDFNDGRIYRIDAAGVVQPNPWDHGLNLPSAVGPTNVSLGRSAITGFDGSSSYAALGRRPWAVRVYKNRLYYSIWSQNWCGSTVKGTAPTEIWSVGLAANGDPFPPARLEATLPPFSLGQPYTNPVADISFGPLGTMAVAERGMSGNNSTCPHNARVLEHSWNGAAWVLPNPTAYQVGVGSGTNSAGGVDFDLGPGGLLWATGDALHLAFSDNIYGLQGLPTGGGNITSSILIDLDDYVLAQNKTQIGDVRLPCPQCATPVVAPVITGPQAMCVSPAHYSVVSQPGVTYSWTVTGGTPTTGGGTSIDVTWNGTTAGTITVVATGPAGCGSVSTSLQVIPCNINCEFCRQFNTTVTMPTAPLNGAGGLQTVTPVVTSNMPGVTSATVTLLNASVAYGLASCGASGPLPAYIPQASPSSAAGFQPPFLPVPNGNQAIWQAGSFVPLGGGATLPFQLQLPLQPPPFCHATYSFCLRVSLATADCRNCDVIRCFGPFPYFRPLFPGDGTLNSDAVLFVLPGPLTVVLPRGGDLAQLVGFLQDASDTALPRSFVIDSLRFEAGKTALTEDSLPALDQLATVLKAFSTSEVRLAGEAGADPRLGREHAQAVRTLLLRAGVPPDRVVAEPGESRTKGRLELVVLRK